MAKLTTFLIMLVVFSMIFAGGIGSWLSSLNDNYNVEDYNSSQISAYNKLDTLKQDTQDLKSKSLELQSNSGVLDVLGGFFESAYSALKVSVSGFSVFQSISEQSLSDANIADAEYYKAGLMLIVILVIFLGIIISVVVKKDV